MIAFLAEYFYLVVVALGVLHLLIWHRARLVELALAAVFIGTVGYILSKLGNRFISSPRPFVVTGHPALISSATDNGFPSDHTLLVSTLAMLVTLVNWRVGIAFWVMVLVVGLARVYAGVHHLIDIAGSIAIIGIATLLYLLALRLWRAWHAGRTPVTTEH